MRRTCICECFLVLFGNLRYFCKLSGQNGSFRNIMGTYNILKGQTDIKLLNHTISFEVMYNYAYGPNILFLLLFAVYGYSVL